MSSNLQDDDLLDSQVDDYYLTDDIDIETEEKLLNDDDEGEAQYFDEDGNPVVLDENSEYELVETRIISEDEYGNTKITSSKASRENDDDILTTDLQEDDFLELGTEDESAIDFDASTGNIKQPRRLSPQKVPQVLQKSQSEESSYGNEENNGYQAHEYDEDEYKEDLQESDEDEDESDTRNRFKSERQNITETDKKKVDRNIPDTLDQVTLNDESKAQLEREKDMQIRKSHGRKFPGQRFNAGNQQHQNPRNRIQSHNHINRPHPGHVDRNQRNAQQFHSLHDGNMANAPKQTSNKIHINPNFKGHINPPKLSEALNRFDPAMKPASNSQPYKRPSSDFLCTGTPKHSRYSGTSQSLTTLNDSAPRVHPMQPPHEQFKHPPSLMSIDVRNPPINSAPPVNMRRDDWPRFQNSSDRYNEPFTHRFPDGPPDRFQNYNMPHNDRLGPPLNDIHHLPPNNVHRLPPNDLSHPPPNDIHRPPPPHDMHRPPPHDMHRPPLHDVHRQLLHDVPRPPPHDMHRPPSNDMPRPPPHDMHRPPPNDMHRPHPSSMHRPPPNEMHHPPGNNFQLMDHGPSSSWNERPPANLWNKPAPLFAGPPPHGPPIERFNAPHLHPQQPFPPASASNFQPPNPRPFNPPNNFIPPRSQNSEMNYQQQRLQPSFPNPVHFDRPPCPLIPHRGNVQNQFMNRHLPEMINDSAKLNQSFQNPKKNQSPINQKNPGIIQRGKRHLQVKNNEIQTTVKQPRQDIRLKDTSRTSTIKEVPIADNFQLEKAKKELQSASAAPSAPEDEDEETKELRRKIEHQKKIREEFLRKKEERRKQQAAKRLAELKARQENSDSVALPSNNIAPKKAEISVKDRVGPKPLQQNAIQQNTTKVAEAQKTTNAPKRMIILNPKQSRQNAKTNLPVNKNSESVKASVRTKNITVRPQNFIRMRPQAIGNNNNLRPRNALNVVRPRNALAPASFQKAHLARQPQQIKTGVRLQQPQTSIHPQQVLASIRPQQVQVSARMQQPSPKLQKVVRVVKKSNSVAENAPTVINLCPSMKVAIGNLASTTSLHTLKKLGSSVGPVLKIESNPKDRKAVIQFKSTSDAQEFQQKFNHYMLDLSVVNVTILPE